MKTKLMIGLTLALLTAVRIGSAQGYIGDTPGAPVTLPYTGVNPFVAAFFSEQNAVQPIGALLPGDTGGPYPFTTVPGDLILLADSNGGNAPSNWAADVRFFNPTDPTGSQGLAATEYQMFLPADVGSAGFANFQLFPNSNFIPVLQVTPDVVTANYDVLGVGPAFGVLAIESIAVIHIPEPGTFALLGLGGIALALNARRRRI